MRKNVLTPISINPNFNYYRLDNAMYLDHANGKTLIRKEINNFGKSDFLQCKFFENGVLATTTTYHEDYSAAFEDIMPISQKITFINNAGKKVFEQTIDVNNIKEVNIEIFKNKVVCKMDEQTIIESFEEELEK